MLFSLPFGLWVIWAISLVMSTSSKGFRGAASTLLCFFAYLSVRYFTPQLGPWEQYGVYILVFFLVLISGLVSETVRLVRQ